MRVPPNRIQCITSADQLRYRLINPSDDGPAWVWIYSLDGSGIECQGSDNFRQDTMYVFFHKTFTLSSAGTPIDAACWESLHPSAQQTLRQEYPHLVAILLVKAAPAKFKIIRGTL